MEQALADAGVEVGGTNRRQVLQTALNNSHDLFEMAPGSRWPWIEPVEPLGQGISGVPLAEEAYRIAMRHDPARQGLHYERIKQLLLDDGVIIRGTNPGKTVFSALSAAKRWFEWTASGTFTWK